MSYYRYELGSVEGSRALTEKEESAVRIAKSISFAILGNIDRDAASAGYSTAKGEQRARLETDFRTLARPEANVTVSVEWDAEDTLFFTLTQGENWTVQQTLYLQWQGNELYQMLIRGGAEISDEAGRDCLEWLLSMAVELGGDVSEDKDDTNRQVGEGQ